VVAIVCATRQRADAHDCPFIVCRVSAGIATVLHRNDKATRQPFSVSRLLMPDSSDPPAQAFPPAGEPRRPQVTARTSCGITGVGMPGFTSGMASGASPTPCEDVIIQCHITAASRLTASTFEKMFVSYALIARPHRIQSTLPRFCTAAHYAPRMEYCVRRVAMPCRRVPKAAFREGILRAQLHRGSSSSKDGRASEREYRLIRHSRNVLSPFLQ